jgi:hypothetical protein
LHSVGDFPEVNDSLSKIINRGTCLSGFATYEAFMTGPGLNPVNARLRDHLRPAAWIDDVGSGKVVQLRKNRALI